ncbi:MAG: hypothetical protein J6A58_02475 [Oscillospiraceae bacterium]|nr:hypothetical protein [Oscillospiraceae bacterium]
MNAEQLQEAIGKIDDKYIAEAEQFNPDYNTRKLIHILSSVSVAVVAMCIVVNCFIFFNNKHHFEKKSIYVVTSVTKKSETEETITCYKTDSEVSISESESLSSVEKTDISESKITNESKDDTTNPPVESDETLIKKTDIINTYPITTQQSPEESSQLPTETNVSYSESENTRPVTTVPSDTPATYIPSTVKPADDTINSTDTIPIETSPFISTVPSDTSATYIPSTVKPTNTTINSTETIPIETSTFISTVTSGNITLYSFPAFLTYEDNKILNRIGIVSKDQVSEFIQKTKFSGPMDSEYLLDEYSFKSISSEVMRIIYFENVDYYVAYMNRNYQTASLKQFMNDSGINKLKIVSEKYTLSDADEKEISVILSDPDDMALGTSSYSKTGNNDVFWVDYEYISDIRITIKLTEKNIVVIRYGTKEYAFIIGKEKGDKIRDILVKYQ